MAERRFQGRAAAPGLAIGPLVELAEVRPPEPRRATTPEAERARLLGAVGAAGRDLAALAAGAGELGAEILELQREMLADPALVEDALEAIAGGEPAETAWRGGLGPQIATFQADESEYFRARASDLADLRDRVLLALAGGAAPAAGLPEGAILLAGDLTPSRFLAMDWHRLGGAALAAGSPTSHVAMLARARGVPLVVDLGEAVEAAADAILDAEAGLLVTRPTAATRAECRRRLALAARHAELAAAARARPATTAAGERVEVMINVDDPAALDDATLQAGDGVGLMRTEFLFIGRRHLPGEDEQYAVYRALLDRLAGRPAIIRTLDVGGDKPLPEITLPAERNPFLGLRGLRLCLERPELFRPQIRALLRAAVDRPLEIMLPMVATAAELAEAHAMIEDGLRELRAARVAAARPPIGIMVETPAAAIAVDTIEAAFYSIGTNDLTQYVMAASREAGGRVAALNDPLQPAVLRLIERVVGHGRASGRKVSLCGDMASDPTALGVLLGLGLRRFSVAPAALGRVKLAIARFGAAADG